MCSRDIRTSSVCTSGVKECPQPTTRTWRLSPLQALIICASATILAGLATCRGLHCTDPDQLCQGLVCVVSIVRSPSGTGCIVSERTHLDIFPRLSAMRSCRYCVLHRLQSDGHPMF